MVLHVARGTKLNSLGSLFTIDAFLGLTSMPNGLKQSKWFVQLSLNGFAGYSRAN